MPEDTNNDEHKQPTAGTVFEPGGGQPEIQNDQPPTETAADDKEPPQVEHSETIPSLAIPAHIQPQKKKSRKGLIIGLVLVLLAAGAGAAWWLTQDKDSKTQQNTEKTVSEIDVLTIGTGEGPASVFFPDEGLNGVQNIMDRQIYEGLVGLENGTIVPFVAQSWSNPDELTWVFKIREGVKFHTGNSVTAEAAKSALDSLSKYDYWSLFTSTIESIEATGPLELTVKTKEPDALLLNRLVLAYITDTTATDKSGNNGTGPYQADLSAGNNETQTTLIAFDEHYTGRPKTRKLVYKIYPSDDEIVAALKRKEVDIIETLPLPTIKQELEGAGYESIEYTSPGAFGLYMNQLRASTPIMKNKDFRTALALAIDRQAMIDEVGNKNTPATQVIPKSLPGHDVNISFPEHNLEAAKASLAKSGYKNQPIEFVYVKDLQLDGPVLIKQLRAAGINIRERVYTTDNVDAALAEVRSGKFDLFTAGFTSDISDARDLLGALLSSTESTYPIYNDPVYDQLLADSDKSFDPSARIKLLQKANAHIAENVAWIPLRNGTYIAYFGKDLDLKPEFNGSGSLGVYYRKVGRLPQ